MSVDTADPFVTGNSEELEAFRVDSAIVNALVGVGVGNGKDKLAQTGVTRVFQTLDYTQKETLFRSNAFCRAVCEVIPQKAVSGGWEVTLGGDINDSDKILKELRAYERKIAGMGAEDEDDDGDVLVSVPDCFAYAQTWANALDGSCIVLNIDDGRPAYEPVDTKRIRTITEIEVLDRTQIRPVIETNWNPLHPKYYELILPENIESLKGMFEQEIKGKRVSNFYIHRSRIIRFDGLITTINAMTLNDGWGGSPLDLLWDELNRWRITQDAIANSVMDSSLFVHKIKGLAKMLSTLDPKNRAVLETRLQLLKMMSGLMGGVAVDAENEDLSYLNRQFNSVPELMKEFRDSLIGASRLPHTLLFGESPSGLGATGESEENSIANLVKEFEENRWRSKLMRLYRLIFLAKDGPTKGKEIDFGLRFNSLIPESESEKATARQTQAQTDNTYVQAGVLDAEEIRQSRFGGEDYSFETTLDAKIWKERKDKENADPFADFSGFGDDQGSLPPGQEQQALPPGQQEPVDLGQAQIQQDSLRVDKKVAPDNDPLYQQAIAEAKTKFAVYPSRYAGAWIKRRYWELSRQKRKGK